MPTESWAKHPFSYPPPPRATPAQPSHLAEMPDIISDHEERTDITREKYKREFAREELQF